MDFGQSLTLFMLALQLVFLIGLEIVVLKHREGITELGFLNLCT